MSLCPIFSPLSHEDEHKTKKARSLTFLPRAKKDIAAEEIKKPLIEHDGVEVIIATRASLKDQCHELMYDIYLEMGYIHENINKRHCTHYDLLPEVIVFLALDRGEAVGTMTIIPDNRRGLPAEEIYDQELEQVRGATTRVCEITSLGIKKDARNSANILIKLFNAATLCAYGALGLTHFIITVHPRHKSFYENRLLFSQAGQQKDCPKVNSAPAILLKMDLEECERNINNAQGNSRLLLKYFVSVEQGQSLLSKYWSAMSTSSSHPNRSFSSSPQGDEYLLQAAAG